MPTKRAATRPLDGIRVVEVSTGIAGPWMGRHLAHHGAEVLRIETHKNPDGVRLYVPPWDLKMGMQPTLSRGLNDWHCGKRFIAMNLAHPKAPGLMQALVKKSDIVLANFSASALEKLGVQYHRFKDENPSLIWINISGFGASGPYQSYMAWGAQIEAMAGHRHLTRFPGSVPTRGLSYPDFLATLHGLFAVVGALNHRARTGKGCYIDLSMQETAAGTLGHILLDRTVNGQSREPEGNAHPFSAPHGVYPCAGDPSSGSGQVDRWCAIDATTDDTWRALCGAMGRPDLLADPRFATVTARRTHRQALDDIISQWTRPQDPWAVFHTLQQAGVPAGVVENGEDAFYRDTHLRARRFWQECDHMSQGKVIATGLGVKLCEPSKQARRTGAAVGQDNDYVFGKVLGMSKNEIEALMDEGLIEAPSIPKDLPKVFQEVSY